MGPLALGCSLVSDFASAWKVQSVGSFIKCDVSGPLKSTGQKIRLREPRGPQIDPKHPKSERPAGLYSSAFGVCPTFLRLRLALHFSVSWRRDAVRVPWLDARVAVYAASESKPDKYVNDRPINQSQSFLTIKRLLPAHLPPLLLRLLCPLSLSRSVEAQWRHAARGPWRAILCRQP